jgi:transposase
MNPLEARKLLFKTYQQTKSMRKTAKIWKTSRNVVRKWVRRFQAEGEKGLRDRSRRPLHSPLQTPPEIENLVIQARQATGYGLDRLSIYIEGMGQNISPYTIRHILRRHGLIKKRNSNGFFFKEYKVMRNSNGFTSLLICCT